MRRVQKGIQTGCRFGVSLPFKFGREQVREWSITEQLWQNMLCVSVLCLAMLVESDNVTKIMNLVPLEVNMKSFASSNTIHHRSHHRPHNPHDSGGEPDALQNIVIVIGWRQWQPKLGS